MDQITRLTKRFDKLYPRTSSEAVSIKIDGWNNLIVKLRNGSTVLYDDCTGSCRLLPPEDMRFISEDDFKREFGKRLQSLMKKLGIKQKTLAEATGINQGTISAYANGISSPSAYNVYKIAKTLNCSVGDLLYLGGD